jgi:hypothetical protein
MAVRPLVAESRPDKVHAWLGINVCAQKARVQKKAEAGGRGHCSVRDVEIACCFADTGIIASVVRIIGMS